MIIRDKNKKEVEIKNRHWPIAEDLFLKWGHDVSTDIIEVDDMILVTPELSAWGIPWRQTSWE